MRSLQFLRLPGGTVSLPHGHTVRDNHGTLLQPRHGTHTLPFSAPSFERTLAGDSADALQIHRCAGVAAGTLVPLAVAFAPRFLVEAVVANDGCAGGERVAWLRQPVLLFPPGSQDPHVEAAQTQGPVFRCFHTGTEVPLFSPRETLPFVIRSCLRAHAGRRKRYPL